MEPPQGDGHHNVSSMDITWWPLKPEFILSLKALCGVHCSDRAARDLAGLERLPSTSNYPRVTMTQTRSNLVDEISRHPRKAHERD